MRIIVRDSRPPQREVVAVAKLYPIMNEPEPETRFPRINLEPEDLEDEVAEAKVVKARRGRRPVVTSEVAEVA